MKRILCIAAAWALACAAVRGEDLSARFDPARPFARAKMGDWLEHRVRANDVSSLTRRALVARTPQRLTFEITSRLPSAGRELRSVIQVVEKTDSREIVRLRLKTEKGRIVDLGSMIPEVRLTMQRKDPFGTPDRRWKPLGRETVTVPAGVFDCRHFRSEDDPAGPTEIWISEDVPLTGLVRMDAPGGLQMILTRFGRDAESEFESPPAGD